MGSYIFNLNNFFMSKAQLYNLPPDRPQHHHPNGITRHQDVDHRQAQLQPPEPWEIAVSSTPKAGDPNETLYPPRAAGVAVKVPVIPISLEAPADRLPLKAEPGCAFPGHPRPCLLPSSYLPRSFHIKATSVQHHQLNTSYNAQLPTRTIPQDLPGQLVLDRLRLHHPVQTRNLLHHVPPQQY